MNYTKVGTGDLLNIRYVEIDLKDKSKKVFYGNALDSNLKILGRVEAKATDSEYKVVTELLKKGCNFFDVCCPKYGNIILINN